MKAWKKRLMVAAAATLAPLVASAQQTIDVIMALPSTTLTFSSPFLAEDAGFYKKEGLTVSDRMLVGVEAVNAVIAGSADFTVGTGPVFLRAAAHGQRLLAVANLIDKPLVEMVMRKDVYETLKITDGMSLAERGRLLKGRTIAIQGVGSIIHVWERVVAARGGLDPETDVRIAPMDPSAMLGALQTKAVDGFTTSLPFTTEAVSNGTAMMYASAARGDAPDLIPFPYGLVQTKPATCATSREKCVRVVRALAEANKMIHDDPDKALQILAPRFKQMNQAVLAQAWKTVAAAHATDLRVTPAVLAKGDQVSIEAKLLDPKDKVQSYDGLYTDQYVP
ncbi:MAG TPA: ABC transporter substrate-binding protein [Stellaceae bacterium]|nr:ABC transporter substrate-binding protein [Stellaceae bacterium]